MEGILWSFYYFTVYIKFTKVLLNSNGWKADSKWHVNVFHDSS